VLIAQIRLLPLTLSIVMAGAQAHAFVRFEESRVESAGPLLLVTASIGAALLAGALRRGVGVHRATAQVIAAWRYSALRLPPRLWRGRAWAIAYPAPLVAVVGAFRPQLFVASRVLARCSSSEMTAILAHERAHVVARDNLVQYLFAFTPGARLMSALAMTLEAQWKSATEEAADQYAGQRVGHLEVASALTKLARLAIPAPPGTAAASALIGETELDVRVLRLIEGGSRPCRVPAAWLPTVLLIAAAVALNTSAVGRAIHELFELLVRSS
jgi:Zn-dependent protease with chaperone function